YQVPNLGAMQNVQSLQQQQAEALRDKNPANRARRLNDIQLQMAKNQANLYTLKVEHKNVEVQAGDDMKVRTMVLAPTFDDKDDKADDTRPVVTMILILEEAPAK